MNLVVPWRELVALIEPHAPVARTGRPAFAVLTMLRIHFMQQWFGLSDPAMEEALHDVPLYREFAGLDAGVTRLPDETTILRFRHLLEAHALSLQIMATINATLAARGLMLKTGTVVDATLIAAPSSTKNASGERDPEMHQTRKGNQWYFGMKAHIGVDAESGLVHTVLGTAANVNDVSKPTVCCTAQNPCVFGDAGYQGAQSDRRQGSVTWHVAMRRASARLLDKTDPTQGAAVDQIERIKASIRAKVEHPFRVIKRQFGHVKVRYRGLEEHGATAPRCSRCPTCGWRARRKVIKLMTSCYSS
jgi:IS5 family transposase